MRVALLHPGEVEWTLVVRIIERPFRFQRFRPFFVAYHDGKILLKVGADLCRIITPNRDATRDVLVPRPATPTVQVQPYIESLYEDNYLLESRGELLWTSIQGRQYDTYEPGRGAYICDLTVFVHALEELLVSTSQLPEKKMRSVRKDAHSLADRVLFLGLHNSFAVEAFQLGNSHAGCVYFIYHNVRMVPHDVFSYNLVNGKAKLVERLPQ